MMEEIFDIANAFEILQSEKLEGDVIFHVTDQKTGLLKKAGDMVVRASDGQTDIDVYAGDETPATAGAKPAERLLPG